MKNVTAILILSVLITGVIVGSSIYLWQNDIYQKQLNNMNLRQESLSQQIVDLQNLMSETQIGDIISERKKQTAGVVNNYLLNNDAQELIGKTQAEIEFLFNLPNDEISAGNRAIWIYQNADEPTAVSFYFEDGKLLDWYNDEYNGPYRMFDEDFLVFGKLKSNDQYEGWQTYTNTDYNYTLKYPSDWTTNDINSQLNGAQQIAVQFTSPDKMYTVTIGVRNKNENIKLLGRSGVADISVIKADMVNMNNLNIPVYGLMINDKISEFMVANLQEGTHQVDLGNLTYPLIDNYEVGFDFMLTNYGQPDLSIDLVSYQFAKKIFESLSYLP